MTYYIGDIPAEALVLDPPETINLDDYTTAEAVMVSPAGVSTTIPASILDDNEMIAVDLPNDASVFPVAGVHRLRVTLTDPAGYSQRIPDVPLVVQDIDSEWHILDTIRAEWPDAEHIPDASLWDILEVAKGQIIAFAPPLAEDAPIPVEWRTAQRVQSRNIWNAARVAPDGTTGQDDFVIRPFPLDWHVRQILRPKRAIGGMF